MAEAIVGSEVVETPVESIETPMESTETVETPVETTEATTPDAVESETTESADVEAAPAKWSDVKAHVDELKKTNPVLAKKVKQAVFALEAIDQLAPGGVPEVKKAFETLQQLGDIEQLNAQRQEWAEIDQKFAAGDVSVLDVLAKENKEGFAKLIPQAFDRLADIDQAAYNRAASGIFAATLDTWQFAPTLDALIQNMSVVVDEHNRPLLTREVAALKELRGKYDGIRTLSKEAPKKEADIETVKAQQERAKIAQEKAQFYGERVARDTADYAKKKYDTLIPAESKSHGLNLDAMRKSGAYDRFVNEIDAEIGQTLAKDPRAKQVQGLIAAGKVPDAVKLSNSLFEGVAGKAVQKVVKTWATLLNPNGVSKPNVQKTEPNGQQPTPAGVKKLGEAPDLSLIDRKDPSWRDNYMMHSKATLKTGQRVTW